MWRPYALLRNASHMRGEAFDLQSWEGRQNSKAVKAAAIIERINSVIFPQSRFCCLWLNIICCRWLNVLSVVVCLAGCV